MTEQLVICHYPKLGRCKKRIPHCPFEYGVLGSHLKNITDVGSYDYKDLVVMDPKDLAAVCKGGGWFISCPTSTMAANQGRLLFEERSWELYERNKEQKENIQDVPQPEDDDITPDEDIFPEAPPAPPRGEPNDRIFEYDADDLLRVRRIATARLRRDERF